MKKAEKKEGAALIEAVSAVINDRHTNVEISPTWVATEAAQRLENCDLVMRAAPDFYIGCHLQLRQIARSQCRSLFEPPEDAPEDASHPLFPDLQWRYPRRPVRDEEPQYILADHMSDDDIDYNVERLRAESLAKAAHADALLAFKASRKAAA